MTRQRTRLKSVDNASTKLQQTMGCGKLKCCMAMVHLWSWNLDCCNKSTAGKLAKQQLDILDSMREESFQTSWDTYVSLLNRCIEMKALTEGRQLHGLMITTGFKPTIYLQNTFLNLYTKCGSMLDANYLLENMGERDMFTWTMMIAGYVNLKNSKEAIRCFLQMEQEGVKPDEVTFLSIIKACAIQGLLEQGEKIHLHIINSRMNLNTVLGNSLIDMYAKCGSIGNARQVFDRMQKQDVVSWNTIIAGYAQQGKIEEAFCLFRNMKLEGLKPDEITYLSILKACGSIEEGKQIYGHIINSGASLSSFVGNTLIDLYVKCESVLDAHEVFNQMPERDTLSWTMMITGYTKYGHAEVSVNMFGQMRHEGAWPNEVTFVSTIKACSILGVLKQGKQIHVQFINSGIQPNIFVGNALVDMYSKCGSLKESRTVFDQMPARDVVSWNAMIAGYANCEHPKEAIDLFWQMEDKDLKPDTATYLSILKACSCLGVLKVGHSIHACIVRSGLEVDVFVGSTIVDMYAKCGSLEDSYCFFGKMTNCDLVSWNSMIAGYVHHGRNWEAFALFWQMVHKDWKPDVVTYLTLVKACTSIGIMEQGRQIHALVIMSGFEASAFVASSLVDMYAKCGSIEDAYEVFNKMADRDVVCWNTIITGQAQHACPEKALKFFAQMKQEGFLVDVVTYVGGLKACASLAAIEKGKYIHDDIIRTGLELDVYVGSTLIDMYAKCGTLKDAHHIFNRMTNHDEVSWNAIIAGYAVHGHAEEALDIFSQMKLVGLKCDHITFISILLACSHAGLVAQGQDYFEFIRKTNEITLTVDHFVCMVDLLGRAGLLQEALYLIERMPLKPNVAVWMALLAACRILGDIKLAVHAAESVLELDPDNDAAIVHVSNLHATVGN